LLFLLLYNTGSSGTPDSIAATLPFCQFLLACTIVQNFDFLTKRGCEGSAKRIFFEKREGFYKEKKQANTRRSLRSLRVCTVF
jgi:hypothetical protein